MYNLIKLRYSVTYNVYLIAVFIISAEIIIVLSNYISLSLPVIRRWRYLVSDISCQYAERGDALPSADDVSFSPKSNSIFFHETSCRGGLTSRQACSVESAARIHPKREVYVLFSAPVNEYVLKRSCLAKLLEFENIKAARVHIAAYAKGTSIEPILMDLEESKYPIQHTSDILRILTLNKWGGVYVDTDMIVVKSLDELPPNWVAKQSDFFLASGILALAKDEVGKNVTTTILELLSQTFNPYDWLANGPYVVQKAVVPLCMSGNNSDYCSGIKIMPYELFYPLHYTLWRFYFRSGTMTNIEPPYSYHMWNYISSTEKIVKGSLYQTLAKKYCPSIYEMYGDEFGI